MTFDSWFTKCKKIVNEDGTVDLVFPKTKEWHQRTIRLFDYQIEFLLQNYDSESLSTSIRAALNDYIRLKGEADRIIITEEAK